MDPYPPSSPCLPLWWRQVLHMPNCTWKNKFCLDCWFMWKCSSSKFLRFSAWKFIQNVSGRITHSSWFCLRISSCLQRETAPDGLKIAAQFLVNLKFGFIRLIVVQWSCYKVSMSLVLWLRISGIVHDETCPLFEVNFTKYSCLLKIINRAQNFGRKLCRRSIFAVVGYKFLHTIVNANEKPNNWEI